MPIEPARTLAISALELPHDLGEVFDASSAATSSGTRCVPTPSGTVSTSVTTERQQSIRVLATVLATVLTLVVAVPHAWSAPPSKEDRKIKTTSRKITRSVMVQHDGRKKAFVFNTDLTTCTPGVPPSPQTCAPSYANILAQLPDNFLPCRGGPFALCYYSGPDGTLPCKVRKAAEGNIADCKCIEVPYGPYFVDIHAIMDKQTYDETVLQCGPQGENCTRPNSAPVCDVVNTRKLIPGADVISVFSFSCVPEEGIAQIPCGAGVYAGCMTAPCYRDADDPSGIVRCECPMYEGPYEVGTPAPIGQCTLPKGNVWSSAHNQTPPSPPSCNDSTYPQPADGASCIPDAPQGAQNACGQEIACPLYPAGLTPAELAVLRQTELCTTVCSEYGLCGAQSSGGASGLQHAYTCDAVLCTSKCAADDSFQDDLLLTSQACGELPSCISSPGITAIMALEAKLGCSCCASQVCDCDNQNAMTKAAIYDLNVAQCARGITPQCCVNGTLCGEKNGEPFACPGGACPS
jgi:hypothetical protein